MHDPRPLEINGNRPTEARMLASGSVTCILNGTAASNRAINTRERLADLFAEHGVESNILIAGNGRELAALARRATEEHGGIVVAAGGDGTINAVASALVGTASPMGVLPLGTLNHFAKDLKIPLELERAVATVLTGRVMRIDVGEVNGHLFLNDSSLGIYPWIARERETRQRKGYRKWLALGRALISVLKRYSLLQVQLRFEGSEKAEVATPFVFVGNNRYESQGLNIGQRSALDEGRLWVCRAPPANRSRLLLLTVKHAFGSGHAAGFGDFRRGTGLGTHESGTAVSCNRW
jgi:diacylglycerol kinase family enzyme